MKLVKKKIFYSVTPSKVEGSLANASISEINSEIPPRPRKGGVGRNDVKILKLKGKTLVIVDWANIWGWQMGLTPVKIWNYFKNYKEVLVQNFYFGLDENDKSEAYLKEVVKLGFKLISKPVKYILGKRKCDFDLEIGLDCFENIDKYDSFVIMSGDGDFATLYERLLKKNKQVVVIFGKNHLGKENRLIKGLFLCEAGNIWQKISPDLRRGRDYKKFTTLEKKVKYAR